MKGFNHPFSVYPMENAKKKKKKSKSEFYHDLGQNVFQLT